MRSPLSPSLRSAFIIPPACCLLAIMLFAMGCGSEPATGTPDATIDSAVGPGDGGGRDAGPDAANGMDASPEDGGRDAAPGGGDGGVDAGTDAGGDDAGGDDAGGDDAGMEDGGGCLLDAALDADLPDGAIRCGSSPPLATCPAATPALDVALRMTTSTPGGSSVSVVRGRHRIEAGRLVEQHMREQMSTPVATDLLRVWRESSPTMQTLYTLAPPTPDPSTLEPKARRDTAATPGVLNGLATFPSYASELLPCLEASDVVDCIAAGGRLTDTGRSDTALGGDPCRVMQFVDGLEVCIPASCDARRSLFPSWVEQSGSGIRVDFEDVRPMAHDDTVVMEPAPCTTIAGGIVLCDHPDL